MSKPDPDDLDDILRQLASENEYDRQVAVEALRELDAERLVELAAHPVGVVRAGVARALRGRVEPELLEAALRLSADSNDDVRLGLSEALEQDPAWAVSDEILKRLFADHFDTIQAKALPALVKRRKLRKLVLERLRNQSGFWVVRKSSLRALAEHGEPRESLTVLIEVVGRDEDFAEEAAQLANDLIQQHRALLRSPPDLPDAQVLGAALQRLQGWEEHLLPMLRKLLEAHARPTADVKKLRTFGQDLTEDARNGRLPRAFHVGGPVASLRRVIEGTDARSAVLMGPSGVGKTAVVHELVHVLAREATDWCVLRIQPSELLVGTRFLGDWQTRVKELVEAVSAPRKVLIYFPNLDELSDVGKATGDQLNVATMLAPYIEDGRIAIVGESTPEAWGRGLGGKPSMRRLFARVDIPALGRDETRDVLELVAAQLEADVAPAAIDQLLDTADIYLADTELPGRAVGLLRRMTARGVGHRYEPQDVLATLHDATGIPTDLLDDDVPVAPDTLRAFFEARVMGQPRAVEHVVDLVTLIKAGLVDPHKPSGVLLFVGPTGVGKTELARALAELLFGDVGRLLRFDMSEFASNDSYQRLIGGPGVPGVLTDAVRNQPFSVVLLDEIEKAHVNVFDLCLQVFDAGRLTDGQGRATSFRNTIVVMTSNLGANVGSEPSIGFDGSSSPLPDAASIQRTLGRFFRPEFLGRIDHVVDFDPLSAATADRIARREVECVLRRGGILRRRMAVDVDPSVYALLLQAGYSPALGARPLKRTVESLVLLPIARVLASGEATAGACLRLFARGRAVDVTVLQSNEEETTVTVTPVSAEMGVVQARVEQLRERAPLLEERRTALVERSNASGFWDDRGGAVETLDAIHRIDRLLEDLDRLEASLEITASNPDRRRAARYLQKNARDAARLESLFGCDDLGDAYVVLTRVKCSQGGLDGVQRLARMYTAWARRLRMECEVLDDRASLQDGEDTITLAVGGAGAHALLAGETGLHRLVLGDAGHAPAVRDLIRVEALPVPTDARALPAEEVRVESRGLRGVTGRLVASLRSEVQLLHQPSMTTLHARSPRPSGEAAASLRGLLAARVARGPAESAAIPLVRRYVLGRAPFIRDRRTGRSTGRLDRVLAGELELVAGP